MNRRKKYSQTVKKAIFRKCKIIPNRNAHIWRCDSYGKIICFSSYGDRNSAYGWNIHHKDLNKNNNKENNLFATSYETHDEIHN